MNARSLVERNGLEFPGSTALNGYGRRGIGGARAVDGRGSSGGSKAIERLVLVSASDEVNPALEARAELIASGMQGGPRVIRAERQPDLSALTKASDLLLVDRKKPLPFIVPYLAGPARRVLRDSRAPMLVVTGVPRAPYRRVVVATDVQTDIADALVVARTIAPNASFTLLHVYRPLFEDKLQWAGVAETNLIEHRVEAQREAALGMATLLARHPTIEPGRTLLRHGWPVPGVLRTAADMEADLIVVVRNTRSWWADALGASVSLEIAQRADRDVLIVHGPTPSRAA